MRVAVITFAVPPFDYKSPWWWSLENLSNREATLDLIGPSGEHQFQRQDLKLGTAHLLNIFAESEEEWTERERVEFSVKTYVYLSKLHKREAFDRFIIADCSGSEPLVSSNLSVLAPTWIKLPIETVSHRGQSGGKLMETANRRFSLTDLTDADTDHSWPPSASDWETIWDELLA